MKHQRNKPCHCGSGKKYKKCHLLIEREEAHQADLAFKERMRQRALEREQAAKQAREDALKYQHHRLRRSPPAIVAALMAGAMMGTGFERRLK